MSLVPFAPPSGELFALARDLGWPRVQLGRVVLDGRQGWETALRRCPTVTPAERTEILRHLERPLLVATEGARARVRHYGRRLGPISRFSAVCTKSGVREPEIPLGSARNFGAAQRREAHMPGPAEPTSLRRFAALMNVNESTIRKAIRTGRLERSIGHDAAGRPVIADVALATQEWRANYDPSRERG